MLKSASGYELGWYMIRSSEKPHGLHRILPNDRPSLYSSELYKLLFIFLNNGSKKVHQLSN